MTLLKIQNLTAGYDNLEILHKLNISLKLGEIVALIGPNGAGKSTVLKSIFGLSNIYSGEIKFADKVINKICTSDLIDLGIGYLPQGRPVFSDLTARENLELGLFYSKDKLDKSRLTEIFKLFPDLESKLNKKASALSGGNQQLLALARTLLQKPKLLLLDEPSLGISPKAIKNLFLKLQEINKRGVSILIVEQNAKQAIKIAHKTYLLENGRVLFSGKDVLKNPRIKKVYLGGDF